jgi:hypothetical protein
MLKLPPAQVLFTQQNPFLQTSFPHGRRLFVQ